MSTLEELQRDNKSLENKIVEKEAIRKLKEEKLRLEQQNENLARELRKNPSQEKAKRSLFIVGRFLFKMMYYVGEIIFNWARSFREEERPVKRKR